MAPRGCQGFEAEVCWERDCCTPSLCDEQARRGKRDEEGTQQATVQVGSQQQRLGGAEISPHSASLAPIGAGRDTTAPTPLGLQSSCCPTQQSTGLGLQALPTLLSQQPWPRQDGSWARQDLPGVLMTNRPKLPLASCQHRCAGVVGPLHPHGQRGLQERGEVSQ